MAALPIAEHADILMDLVKGLLAMSGFLVVAVCTLLWWHLRDIKSSVKEIFNLHLSCRTELDKKFADKNDVENLWTQFSKHCHEPEHGKVIRDC